ncbi:MAG: hypothetical protein A2V66_15905 [Ignavibacteria bacterium RBG_13_36_8]|nr:MAG: hypothetical protein A2V66_15905 [Ignavibacteria bacterium RBG_13_36_8]
MKTLNVIILMLMVVAAFSNCVAQSIESDEAAITKVIEKAYIGGAFNDKDTKAMEMGFHKSFTIQAEHEDEFEVTTLNKWIDELNSWKSGEASEGGRTKDWNIAAKAKVNIVAVYGDAAVARVDVTFSTEHIFTAFLTLHKFDDGWMIVNLLAAHDGDE